MEPFEIEYAPLDAFRRLHHLKHPVFLDSSRFHPKQGRYTFFAADPFVTFGASGGKAKLTGRMGESWCEGDPWEILDATLSRFRTPDVHPIFPNGGAFGFLSYEMGRWLESMPTCRAALIPVPEVWFGFYDVVLAFDHQEKRGWLISSGLDDAGVVSEAQAVYRKDQVLDEYHTSVTQFPHPQADQQLIQMVSQTEHQQSIRKALAYIHTGDVYQVNLSYPFLGTVSDPAVDLYLRLREVNPAPFSAYLDFGEGQILSSSPERFLRMDHRRIEARPIKGTCARTGDPAQDAMLSRELLQSVKNRAELLMITDLLRNDLGKVAEFGSVKVPSLVAVEEYETVFHLVSTIEARLTKHILHLDALAACFPGGSITGAPKIRSMEIIHELEPYQRGIYTGSLGYIGFNGISDFNILIRSLIHQNGRVSFHVGGGIVADSDPLLEYEETLHKARAILRLWASQGPSAVQPNRSTLLRQS